MMTDGEICREYRLAKDKDKQIGIIADQCGMDSDEIIKVLVDCGEMEPPRPRRKSPAKQRKADVPEAVADILHKRIDELDKLIKPLEDELKPLKEEFEQIAGFLNGQEVGR